MSSGGQKCAFRGEASTGPKIICQLSPAGGRAVIRVFDHQLIARRFLENRSELLQYRAHGAGAQHLASGRNAELERRSKRNNGSAMARSAVKRGLRLSVAS
jgi:hypothetical protein